MCIWKCKECLSFKVCMNNTSQTLMLTSKWNIFWMRSFLTCSKSSISSLSWYFHQKTYYSSLWMVIIIILCSKSNYFQSQSDSNVYRSVFWSIIVFASVVSGGFFLHDNTSEFLKSTVQTTLDSMVPLSQVLFPSVVVCNINQIRKSLFNELGFYDNETLVRIMYEDFIKGTKDNSENSTYLGPDHEDDEHHTIKRKEFYQVKLSLQSTINDSCCVLLIFWHIYPNNIESCSRQSN